MGGRGGSSGSGGGPSAAVRKLQRGVSDADLHYLKDRESFRSLTPFREAFAKAKAAGISPTKVAVTGRYPGGEFPPIRIDIEHTGKTHLHDGRHRYTSAREAGATRIRAIVREYGPRGGAAFGARDGRQVEVVPARDAGSGSRERSGSSEEDRHQKPRARVRTACPVLSIGERLLLGAPTSKSAWLRCVSVVWLTDSALGSHAQTTLTR